jgi:hypothetical protein
VLLDGKAKDSEQNGSKYSVAVMHSEKCFRLNDISIMHVILAHNTFLTADMILLCVIKPVPK